jgi:quercetin dioxygenase-like cupin family protein
MKSQSAETRSTMIGMPAGDTWTVLVAGEHTDGRFAVVETRERHGAGPPKHVHSREDELICVLDGHVTFDRDGERLDGPAGTWLFLPRGIEHAFSVESPEARLLVVLSPAGLEGYLRELSQTGEAVAELQLIERLVATVARYGIAITGPGWQCT